MSSKKNNRSRKDVARNHGGGSESDNEKNNRGADPPPASTRPPTTRQRPNQEGDGDDFDCRPTKPPARNDSSSGRRLGLAPTKSSRRSRSRNSTSDLKKVPAATSDATDKKSAASEAISKTEAKASPKNPSAEPTVHRQKAKNSPDRDDAKLPQKQGSTKKGIARSQNVAKNSGTEKGMEKTRVTPSAFRSVSTSGPNSGNTNNHAGRNSFNDDDGSQADQTLSTAPGPPSLRIRNHYSLRPGAYRITTGGVARFVDANDDLDNDTALDIIDDNVTTLDPTLPFGSNFAQDDYMPLPPPMRPTTSDGSSFYDFHSNRIGGSQESHGQLTYGSRGGSNGDQNTGGAVSTVPTAETTRSSGERSSSRTRSKRKKSSRRDIPSVNKTVNKTESTEISSTRPRFTTRFLLLMGCLVILLLVVCVSVTVVYARAGNLRSKEDQEKNGVIMISEDSEDEDDDDDDDETTMFPTVSPPSSPPFSSPQLTPMNAFVEALPEYTKESIGDPESPQSKALQWMSTYDNAETFSMARKLQRFALMTLNFSVAGDDLASATLMFYTALNECDWYKSTCVDGMFTELTLVSKKATYGTIVPELALLSSLELLGLNQNSLAGTIPTELGLMTSLREINMNGNRFRGTIPTEFGRLTNLEYIDLGDNLLSGPIPTEIGSWNKLLYLNVTGNDLTGDIPSEIGRITDLASISLSFNKLKGSLPPEFGLLGKIKVFDVGKNYLTGDFVSAVKSSKFTLETLDVESNKFSGSLPSAIGDLTKLSRLDVSANGLTGVLPREIGGLTDLVALDVSSNELRGTIPSELGMLTNAGSMLLQFNLFSGTVPEEICDLTDSLFTKLVQENLVVDCTNECDCCQYPPKCFL
ncbi:unnamed protein product [Pseudo-nitzschia multistriata]|uniref:L domain-like protein n=1 Tax=Pseudo-nitzschia multistriata TaxID=183589 RepID=A0A448ZSE4_9STRA|nr:unnamed protein product [Pseudo-nitzschia multistriata]